MTTMVDAPIDTSNSSVMAQEIALLEAAEEQLRQSTARHAAVFVHVARRSERVTQLLQQLVQQIDAATQSAAAAYPALAQDDALASCVEQHRIRRRTLLQHAALLELLELPNLMDACVRSSSSSLSASNNSNNHDSFVYYEEALQIAAFANTLERRHVMDENRVISDVIAQIRSRQAELRPLLLSRLRTTSTTMSECLEVVTALRRLNALELEQSGDRNLEVAHADTERRLQIAFLEARDSWLDSTTTTTSESLLDAIERHRTRLFEVATQFNAIFRAQSTTTSSSQQQQQLLVLWMARRVQSFLQFLRAALATKEAQDAAVIRDALEAAVFFATSLGRLGADFTSLLAEPFEAAMVRVVTQPWLDGVAQLQETLTLCRDAGVAGPLTAAVDVAGSDDSHEYRSLPLEEPLPPPKQLLALPPLARLVNAVLTGLNALRRCLLPGIFPTLRHCLETQVLQLVEKELQRHERTVLTPGFAGETAALRASAAALSTTFRDLVPHYLRGALEAAIGNAPAARSQHTLFLEQLARGRGLEGGAEDDPGDEANPNEQKDLVVDVAKEADDDLDAELEEDRMHHAELDENVAK